MLVTAIGFTGYQQRLQRTQRATVPGMPEAVATLQKTKATGEPVLVCNPMLYLNVCVHNDGLTDVYAADPGRPFPHFQGAPVMREEEYFPVAELRESDHEWVWTLDADNWLRGSWKVHLPGDWQVQEERQIREWYATLVIRAYRREGVALKKDNRLPQK